MRAGPYATFNGATYRSNYADGTPIRLLAPLSDPQPPGFERDRHRRWSRRVERSALSETFFVKTTARWKGKTVEGRKVLDNRAFIEYFGDDLDGRPELSQHKHGLWDGDVHMNSLSDVVEEVTEIPL